MRGNELSSYFETQNFFLAKHNFEFSRKKYRLSDTKVKNCNIGSSTNVNAFCFTMFVSVMR